MKLIQSCPCGADIRVESEPGHSAERADAQGYLSEWRAAHEPCLKRMERHGLLREGDTALSVRAALDA
jgi:hypothetical protein